MVQYKDNLLGEVNSFFEVLEQVFWLVLLDKLVLVIGECGIGKEFIVNCFYYFFSCWQGLFILLNCVVLNDNLFDLELFGYEVGVFIGVSKCYFGCFECVDGGMLFFDELVIVLMLVQEKLLRVIEYGELECVGGSQLLQVNVWLVCVINVDLLQMVEEGYFCVDLFDCLVFDVVQFFLLCDWQSDIMLFVNQFVIQMCCEFGLLLFFGFSE